MMLEWHVKLAKQNTYKYLESRQLGIQVCHVMLYNELNIVNRLIDTVFRIKAPRFLPFNLANDLANIRGTKKSLSYPAAANCTY